MCIESTRNLSEFVEAASVVGILICIRNKVVQKINHSKICGIFFFAVPITVFAYRATAYEVEPLDEIAFVLFALFILQLRSISSVVFTLFPTS